METIKVTLHTVFERDNLLTFLDQFDQIVYDNRNDVKSWVEKNAPDHQKSNLLTYFNLEEITDPEELFTKSKLLRKSCLELEKIGISVPTDLSSQFMDTIFEWMKINTGRDVILDIKHDPELIAGGIIESNGFISEHSIRAFFEKRISERRQDGF